MSLADLPMPSTDPATPSGTLRRSTAAVRVSFTWFGTRKAVSTSQRDQMAAEFDADGQFLSAGKKLLNTKHPAFKALTSIKTETRAFWISNTLPFPEDGIRLLKQSAIDDFEANMRAARDDLAIAVVTLGNHYREIREEARQRLGSLFDPSDYPATLEGLFAVTWDYPSVEPPDYLMELKPALYEAERQRVAARFDEAVRLAEEGFTTEFAAVVAHLCERLSGTDADGKPKVFRDSAVTNALDFFQRFKSLNVSSNAQLDALVEQARDAVQGVQTKDLRKSAGVRATVAEQLAAVREQLDTMVVDRPRRRIIRPVVATPTPAPVAEEAPADAADIPF